MAGMAFYDWFAKVYDDSLQALYAQHRVLACQALGLEAGMSVLDVPTGTGASLRLLAEGGGADGAVVGVDLSEGMLRRARMRTTDAQWSQVHLLRADVTRIDGATLQATLGREHVDRLHVFLGMSVFPDMERAFEGLWSRLAPGGACVLVDVHAERLGMQGQLVNWIARAEIRRRFWEPLQARAEAFALQDLPHEAKHGGQIKLAYGRKPE